MGHIFAHCSRYPYTERNFRAVSKQTKVVGNRLAQFCVTTVVHNMFMRLCVTYNLKQWHFSMQP